MQANALHRKPRIMLRHLLFAGLTCNLETDAFAMLRAIGRLDVTILKIQICMVQVGSWNLLAETPTQIPAQSKPLRCGHLPKYGQQLFTFQFQSAKIVAYCSKIPHFFNYGSVRKQCGKHIKAQVKCKELIKSPTKSDQISIFWSCWVQLLGPALAAICGQVSLMNLCWAYHQSSECIKIRPLGWRIAINCGLRWIMGKYAVQYKIQCDPVQARGIFTFCFWLWPARG